MLYRFNRLLIKNAIIELEKKYSLGEIENEKSYDGDEDVYIKFTNEKKIYDLNKIFYKEIENSDIYNLLDKDIRESIQKTIKKRKLINNI